MKRIEAKSLEEAYKIACDSFDCSIKELKYEIVQYPSNGILGLFSKSAVIIASANISVEEKVNPTPKSSNNNVMSKDTKEAKKSEIPKEELILVDEEPQIDSLNITDETPNKEIAEEDSKQEQIVVKNEEVVELFFEKEKSKEEAVVENEKDIDISNNNRDLALKIENQIKNLIDISCFNIDIVEVDVIDNRAYIFLDGDDAALLIGKEGYRYNALSYLLFSWLQAEYKLFVKLEIAQFLSSQEEMIRHTLKSVIEDVNQKGWGRTKPLDGILVHIALEQLRKEFPNKYVAIKRQRDGSRYVLINEFNNSHR